jgi:hypothetical protein
MTDEPSPSEPSEVGFAAIRPPDQTTPPPGQASPPGTRGGRPSAILIGGITLLLILVLGTGAMLAFNLGPFGGPTPTPTRVAQPTPTIPLMTPSARPSASVRPTATPAPQVSPTPDIGPTATPIPSGDVIAVLLSHIPGEIVGSCASATGEGKVLARAKCSARDGNIGVTYFLYADHDSMFATYDGFRVASEIEPNSGNCNKPATWPAESDFAISGRVSGRFLCTEALGATTVYWTDNRLNIFSQATDIESDYARLVDFWVHDSGPNMTN